MAQENKRSTVASMRLALARWVAPGPIEKGGGSAGHLERGNTPAPVSLRSLSPEFDAEEHAEYVEVLKAALLVEGDRAPLNVALTGHYGSGKSSVLLEVAKQLLESQVQVINLSMPSLGIGSGRLPKDGEPGIDRTNLIQKEIVKQLLYRQRPSQTPASRYNRLDVFDSKAASRRSWLIAAVTTFAALLYGLPQRVGSSFPKEFWAWVNAHTVSNANSIIQWLILPAVLWLTHMTAMWLHRVIQQRLRITELGAGAGPATVKLSEPTASFFDEYLDEIVYFFQVSKTTVVIFEDLDRFHDPHIFETLRELNLLLNNAEQTGTAAIRFVYAIRDSIFEQLDLDIEDDSRSGFSEKSRGVDQRATQIDSKQRRLITTNRTKFFDLVVPMVPFISHRTSRDIINAELQNVSAPWKPSNEVVDLVSRHITDMRLIKNICNEYEIFRVRILGEGRLEHLNASNLFASIVYKNLYLLDYEEIRTGTSRLDTLYSAYREWVKQLTAFARRQEKVLRSEIRRTDSVNSRRERLGRRLQAIVVNRTATSYLPQRISISVGGQTFSYDDLVGDDFWEAYLQGDAGIGIVYPNPQYYQQSSDNVILSPDRVEALVGETIDVEQWEERDRASRIESAEEYANEQLRYAHASLSDALNANHDKFNYDSDQITLIEVATRLFVDDELVIDLLREGFLDENFALYATQFPGGGSAISMNFVVKAVQPNIMDMHYHFGSGDSQVAAIEGVLRSESARVLNGESVYNIEIFDYLLGTREAELAGPIARLAFEADSERSFIDVYVSAGKHVDKFITVLAGRWAGIFEYLIGQDADLVDVTNVDAAARGVQPDLNYRADNVQCEVIGNLIESLPFATTPQAAKSIRSFATALARMGVEVPHLAALQPSLRAEVIARSNYRLSLENLHVLAGGNRTGLDSIKGASPEGVYDYLVDHLRRYLEVIEAETESYSIDDRKHFEEVILDIANAEPEDVEVAASLARPGVRLEAFDAVDASIWRPLMRVGRVRLSAKNVAAYIDGNGIDQVLIEALKRESIEPASDDAINISVATSLLAAGDTGDAVKLRAIEELGLFGKETFSPNLIGAASLHLIPTFVRTGTIADTPAAFEAIEAEDWDTKAELMSVSEELPSYIVDLELETRDLLTIVRDSVPNDVKRAVLSDLGKFAPVIGKCAASGFLSWAARVRMDLAPDAIHLLASKADGLQPKAVFELLIPHAESMDLTILLATVNSLGGDFARLTYVGRDMPRVPAYNGVDRVLARLQSAGIVSKYEFDQRRNRYKVSKRRS